MPDPRRLLQVAPTYPPYVGGVEIHTQAISQALAGAWDVTVLTTDPDGTLPPVERGSDGVSIVRVPGRLVGGDLAPSPRLMEIIRDGGWDVVHVQGYHTYVPPLALIAARSARLPYVMTFHSGGHDSRLRHALRVVQLLALRPWLMGAHRLVAVSPFERDVLARQLRLRASRFSIVPNGCDLPPGTRSSTDSRPLILSVGRVERYKGHHRLVEALPALLANFPEARLVVVGTGPRAHELLELARSLDIGHRVEVRSVDARDRQAMADLYADADVVALLSDYESHGLAAVEAAAAGRPLVVTDGSALADLVGLGAARGVRPGAPAREVAAAIGAELSQETPRQPFSAPTWRDAAALLDGVYRSAIAAAA